PERPPLPRGPYLVVGLARSGVAAARMLVAHGEVIGTDAGSPDLGPDPGFEVHVATEGVELLDGVRTVVKSPGVPWSAPVIVAASERGLEVTGELELAWRLLPANPFVAVTGTNGKTTTVELLGAVWRAAGRAVEVAGNVGRPVAALVGAVEPATTVVCEASSFQLEDTSAFAPEAAVLLNVEEDHLDRHGTVEAYTAAKLRAFARQDTDGVAVAPEGCRLPGGAERITFGSPRSDMAVVDGQLRWRGEPLMAVADLSLRGAHNVENAMGAAAVALACGIPAAAVVGALSTFGGVPHRLEEVAERDGVLYVNDSKATNPASAARGIEAFRGGVHVILGGSLKGGDFRRLRAPLAERVRAAYLIGPAAESLAADLTGAAPLVRAQSLQDAVAQASIAARPGEVVLLSPACASFDAFEDYEHRGRRFKELVAGLG
ncbi:MAG: UDP-N-acetylmuramoyl-L-alanine--D-glutamate ligase, partial [Thermoleophilaceae bacterium]